MNDHRGDGGNRENQHVSSITHEIQGQNRKDEKSDQVTDPIDGDDEKGGENDQADRLMGVNNSRGYRRTFKGRFFLERALDDKDKRVRLTARLTLEGRSV